MPESPRQSLLQYFGFGTAPPQSSTLPEVGYTCSVDKFYTRDALIAARAEWKKAGRKVVFTNGCYDLLHPGHVRLLEQARSLGDVLILALNSDDSVRRLKGPSRPLLSEM